MTYSREVELIGGGGKSAKWEKKAGAERQEKEKRHSNTRSLGITGGTQEKERKGLNQKTWDKNLLET